MRSRSGTEDGFTLLEMLVVMVVAAALAALAIPGFGRSVDRANLRLEATQLTADLNAARDAAMRRARQSLLIIDVEAGAWTNAFGESFRLHKATSIGLIVGDDGELGSSRGAFSFFPDGSSSGGQISLRRGNLIAEIHVDWLTGRADAILR